MGWCFSAAQCRMPTSILCNLQPIQKAIKAKPHTVTACLQTAEGEARIVCVINAGRKYWQGGDYGVWVGGGTFEEIFCSQTPELGGWEGTVSNAGEPKPSHDGKLWINLPPQCTLVFKQVD